MMGPKQEAQAALFYEFSLEDHVPQDHLLRSIDRFADLSSIRAHLVEFYSHTGRPSVDPELMIRMLLVGYCFGIRSERRLCEEVHLNSPIAGSAVSIWPTAYRIIRRFLRTAMAASARVICCATSSRRLSLAVWKKDWLAVRASPLMPA